MRTGHGRRTRPTLGAVPVSYVFGFRLVEVATMVLAAGSALVGLFIAGLAYRGLRRYRSRQMLYLSVGLVLLFGAAYALSMVGTVLVYLRALSLPQQDIYRLAVRFLQFLGLLSIAYSLSLSGDEPPVE